MPPKAPNRRGRSAKAALSREAVLEAALTVVRQEGLRALSMRRLAAELDTGAASLYVYFANRDELVAATFDQVVGTVETEPADPERWREQTVDLLVRSREVMERHPGIALVAVAAIPTGDNAMRGADALMGYLRAGGFSDSAVAWAADVLFLYVTAAALENTVRADDGHNVRDEMSERFTNLSAEEYPTLAALGPALVSGEGEDRFRFGLELMLNGLAHTRAG